MDRVYPEFSLTLKLLQEFKVLVQDSSPPSPKALPWAMLMSCVTAWAHLETLNKKNPVIAIGLEASEFGKSMININKCDFMVGRSTENRQHCALSPRINWDFGSTCWRRQ